jgi:hypothetical protein
VSFDNSTDEEIEALIRAYIAISPGEIMLYSIDRKTPEQSLEKIDAERLRAIAARIQAHTNIPVLTA